MHTNEWRLHKISSACSQIIAAQICTIYSGMKIANPGIFEEVIQTLQKISSHTL